MIYFQLLYTFFKIGLFSFGGGYAMLSLIQDEVVGAHQWMSHGEFADIVAISQMTPGPISINCATYIGYTTTGSPFGSALATLGLIAPSIILMLIASIFIYKLRGNRYLKNVLRAMRPIVIGLILSAAFLLYNEENFIDIYSYIIFAVSLVLAFMKINPLFIIVLSGVAGCLIY